MFSIQNNTGRGGLFAPVAKVMALANDIASHGWLETSSIVCDNASESQPLATAGNVLLGLLDGLKRVDSQGKPVKHKVQSKSYTLDELEEAVKAWTEANTETMGKSVAIGNTRALACVLCWSLGHEVEPVIVEKIISTELAIRDNAAHALASKLDNIQRLQSALVLASEGKVNKESDLRHVYGHGTGQRLWLQLQAVQVHGLKVEEAVTLKPTKEVRELVKAPVSKATKASLKAMSEGETSQGEKAKTMPAVKVLELAAQFPAFEPLLVAIANGQELTARNWLAAATSNE